MSHSTRHLPKQFDENNSSCDKVETPCLHMPIASSEPIELLSKLYGVEGTKGSMDGFFINCGYPVAQFRKVREG